MRLSFVFARRYLLSRKSLSVINIISRVSIFAVGIPVAAMVILLSVFNGFEEMVRGMYGSFDPDLTVLPAQGKMFERADLPPDKLGGIDGLAAFSYLLEEPVLLEYRGRQAIATLRGVDSGYKEVVPMEELIVSGEYELRHGDMEQLVVGQGIAYDLGIRTTFYQPVTVYYPRRGSFSSLLPLDAASRERAFPGGVFALDAQTDGQYVFATLAFMERLLDCPGSVSRIDIRLNEGVSPEKVRAELVRTAGDRFRILTRNEQHAALYRMMNYEKWAIFFITLLVLVISSFSIVGSLLMLILDKQGDIRTLLTMGADVRFVRGIFVREGMLITVAGTAGGLLLGLAFCLVQQQFGLIKIGAETFLMDSYPVRIEWTDLAGIVVTVIAVNYAIVQTTVAGMLPRSIIRI